MTTATETTVSAEEAAALTKLQIIDQVKAKFPGKELREATHPELPDWIIFRIPTRPEYRIYKSMVRDETKRADAGQMLVDTCVVWPDKDELVKQLEAHPALTDVWAAEIVQGSGQTMEARQKKL